MDNSIETAANDSRNGQLARIVLNYGVMMGRLVAKAKLPGFTVADWAPLAELVAVDEFERVGAFREVMNWREYTEFLTQWACSSGWEGTYRRITELPGLVFLELEERSIMPDQRRTVVNSVSVYEFNKANKIRHLAIYLQGELWQG